jgi:hypothetical protein
MGLKESTVTNKTMGDLMVQICRHVALSIKTELGTSDLPVAQEAAFTVRLCCHRVDLMADVGVAGLHRLLSRLAHLRAPRYGPSATFPTHRVWLPHHHERQAKKKRSNKLRGVLN